MKKLFVLVLVCLLAIPVYSQEFHRKTRHNTVKRLKKKEIKKIQSGHNMYYRENDKVYKTSGIFSGIKRPKDASKKKPSRRR